jgi:hypothetical protein
MCAFVWRKWTSRRDQQGLQQGHEQSMPPELARLAAELDLYAVPARDAPQLADLADDQVPEPAR